MIRVILWKEWRQQAAIAAAFIAVAAILIAAVACFFPVQWQRRATEQGGTAFIVIFWLLAIGQAIVSGAMLFAGENEDGTQAFLDCLPAFRRDLWLAKIIAGLGVVAATTIVFIIALRGLGIRAGNVEVMYVMYSLAALACAIGFSVKRRTMFGALGIATLGMAVCVFAIPFAIAILVLIVIGWNLDAYGLNWPVALLSGIACLAWSRLQYCRLDAGRLPLGAIDRSRFGFLFRLAIWPTYSRHKVAVVSLVLVAALTAVLTGWGREPFLFWPLGMFLFGCIAGWSVFADDQAEDAARFLGDQRFPPNRAWAKKVFPWLGLVLLLSIPTLAAAAIPIAIRMEARRTGGDLDFWQTFVRARWLVSLLFAMNGFAFAAFALQQTRKVAVAVFLTLILGSIASAAWYPSLFNGMSVWPALAVPAAFLLATLLLWRRWTSGRLHDRGGIVGLVLLLVCSASWIGGNLWWRVAQIPDIGEPFDVAGFRQSVAESSDENGTRLREAAVKFQERVDEAEKQFPLIGADGLMIDPSWWEYRWGTPDWGTFRYHAAYDGLPTQSGPHNPYLDFLLQGNWAAEFAQAAIAPLDRLEPMQDFWGVKSHTKELKAYGEAVQAFLIRARIRLRQSRTAEALEDIAIALAAVRHGLHRTNGQWADMGFGLHSGVLRAAGTMLRDPGADMTFIRGLADVLARHEALLPPFTEIAKADYLRVMEEFGAQGGTLFTRNLLTLAPWEQERARRLANIATASFLANGGAPLPSDSLNADFERLGMLFEGSPIDPKDYFAFLWRYKLSGILRINAQRNDYFRFAMTELHALRLGLAAAIYHADNGQPIASLDDLTPKYFASLPKSYVGDGAFRYFVAAGGEELIQVDGTFATRGQGLIAASPNSRNFYFVPTPSKK